MSATLYSAKYSGASPDNLMFAACRSRYSSANLSNSTSSIRSHVPIRNELEPARRHELANARARQGVALGRPGIRPIGRSRHVFLTRMAHELYCAPPRQACEHFFEIGLVEAAAKV